MYLDKLKSMPRQFIKNIFHLSEIFYKINVGIALSLFFFHFSCHIFTVYTLYKRQVSRWNYESKEKYCSTSNMENKRNLIMNKGFIIFTKYIYSISVTKAPTVIYFSHNKNIYPLPDSTLSLDRVNIFYFEKYTASGGFVL